MLADPAESGVARERLLQDRAAVDEHAMRAGNAVLADFLSESRETSAQDLVIVAAERVARDVRALGVAQDLVSVARLRRQVVHARRDDAQGSGDQLLRPRASAAMPLHVVHCSMAALFEPAHQALLVRRDLDTGDADLLEAELAAPLADRACQLVERCVGYFVRHARCSIRFGRLRP